MGNGVSAKMFKAMLTYLCSSSHDEQHQAQAGPGNGQGRPIVPHPLNNGNNR